LQDDKAIISWPMTAEPFALNFARLIRPSLGHLSKVNPSANRNTITVRPTTPGLIYRLRGE
jgi:hypothetical protein